MFLRYCAVGCATFAVDFVVTLLLAQVVHYLVANTFGFIVANAFQFVVAHGWVFGQSFERQSLWKAYAATLAISLLGLVASNLLMFFFVSFIGLALPQSKALTAIAVLFLNFFLRVSTVYRSTR